MSAYVSRFIRSSLLIVVVLFLLFGCSSGGGSKDDPEGDEISFELFDSTVQLNEQDLATVSDYDGTSGKLSFQDPTPTVAAIKPKMVILGGVSPKTPRGLLRVVANVTREGGNLVLETVPAPLQLAFRKLHVKLKRTLVMPKDQKFPALRPQFSDSGSKKWSVNFSAYNGDGDDSTKDDQMLISASSGLSYDFVLGIDTDWTSIEKLGSKLADCIGAAVGLGGDCDMPDVRVGFYAALSGDSSLNMEGAAYKQYEAPFEIAKIPFDPFYIGPLVFVPSLSVDGKLSGGASSDVHFGMGVHGSFKGGVKYSLFHGSDEQKPTTDFGAYVDKPRITLKARGRAQISAKMHLYLFDIIGPYVGLTAYAQIDADQDSTPCWDLHGGADIDMGFDIQATSYGPTIAEWHASYPVVDKSIASGTCDVVPESYHPDAMGGDAQAEQFAHPSFDPWSNYYDGDPLLFLPALGPGSSPMWIDVSSTVDGRFVIGGSHCEALTKLDERGNVVWSRKYLTKQAWNDTTHPEVLPGHAVAASDGTMFVEAYPYVLMNVEQDGRLRWARSLDIPYRRENGRWTSIIGDGSGGAYVTGPVFEDKEGDSGGRDALLVRFDSKGALLWAIRLGAPDSREIPFQLSLTNNGVLVAGNTEDQSLQRVHWLAYVSNDGQSVKGTGIELHDCGESSGKIGAWATREVSLPNGDLMLAGRTIDSSFVLKVKPDGHIGWAEELRTARIADSGPQIQTLIALPTSGYLVSGTVGFSRDGHIGTEKDMLWLGMLDGAGHLQWSKRYAGLVPPEKADTSWDIGANLLSTRDGGVIMAGYTGAVGTKGGLWVSKVPAKSGDAKLDSALVERGSVDVSNTGQLCAESSTLGLSRIAVTNLVVHPLSLTQKVVHMTAKKLINK